MHTIAKDKKAYFDNQRVLELFNKLYGNDINTINNQVDRYKNLIDKYFEKFSEKDIHVFSSPGRTELSGNHTDHNNGKVLAASIDLDSIAVASTTDDNIVTVYSSSFQNPFIAELNELEPQFDEYENTVSIIRGTAARLKELGFNIGGFNAFISSNIPIGSGLSSSASIEVLIANIFNCLYNEKKIDKNTIALISQYAENKYFGKPCGLMDQLSIAIGGIVKIDFKCQSNPVLENVEFDFAKHGYRIVLVDTGSNHSDLTDEYALIPFEMKSVVESLGLKYSIDITKNNLIENIASLRSKVGDRAILRMAHFIDENERVLEQITALEKGNIERFLDLVIESGDSSFKWLQNSFVPKTPEKQGISLALMITENFINTVDKKSACRVHGGGFAGTIQAFIPNENVEEYTRLMNKIFGDNSAHVLNIRSLGAIELSE